MVALYATDKIARFVTGFNSSAISEAQMKTVARALIDTYAVATAARNDLAVKAAQAYVAGHSGPVLGSLWSNGNQVPIELAALANGVAAQLLDYGDVVEPLSGGVSAVAVPALCALAEATNSKGRQFAAAYIIAFEVAVKLARALGDEPSRRGWHTTSVLGLLGTTAGAAHMLALNADQVSYALALSASLASGSQEQIGTMGNAAQVGQTASTALRVVQLARLNVAASKSALDGSRGLAALISGSFSMNHLDALGQAPFEIDSTGIDIKRYPCSYAVQGAIEAALLMRSQYGLNGSEITGVEVTAQPNGLRALIYPRAVTGAEARYSMHYALAAAFLDGKVNLGTFTDAMVQRNEVQSFYKRVIVLEDEEAPESARFTIVKLALKSGSSVERRVEAPRGSARAPLNDREMEDKARECFGYGKTEVWAKDFASTVYGMATVPMRDVLRAGRMG
jgi:2-methylcitrate dehydratase PrpD